MMTKMMSKVIGCEEKQLKKFCKYINVFAENIELSPKTINNKMNVTNSINASMRRGSLNILPFKNVTQYHNFLVYTVVVHGCCVDRWCTRSKVTCLVRWCAMLERKPPLCYPFLRRDLLQMCHKTLQTQTLLWRHAEPRRLWHHLAVIMPYAYHAVRVSCRTHSTSCRTHNTYYVHTRIMYAYHVGHTVHDGVIY